MSGYPQGEQIQELARRTISNLSIVERVATKEALSDFEKTAFEVTQLINSFLGLIVAPQEQLYSKYPEKFSDDYTQRVYEWCKNNGSYFCTYCIKGCPKNGEEPDTLKEFIRHIRNCVAHMSFSKAQSGVKSFFQPVGGKEITDLYFMSSRQFACNRCSKKDNCSSVKPSESRQLFRIIIPIKDIIDGQSVQVMKTLIIGFSNEISIIANSLK